MGFKKLFTTTINKEKGTTTSSGNGPTTSINNAQRRRRQFGTGRSSSFTPSSSCLQDKDLDNIYKFVNQMKQTNLGDHMLEEFVVRRASEEFNLSSTFLSGDSDLLKEASSSAGEMDPFPIQTIQVVNSDDKTMKRSPNAA